MNATRYPVLYSELEAPPSADPAAVAGLLQRTLGGARGATEGAAAYARGERNPGRLADVIFHARHPERRGRAIQGEPRLAQEWTWLRDQVVAPALRQAATLAPVPTAPPARVPAPAPSRFTVPPDPSHLLPAPRTNVTAIPLFPGDVALAAETRLIREIATRRDGWVYIANWYAGLATRMPAGPFVPQLALAPFTNALVAAGRAGARIRALFWDGSMNELRRQIDSLMLRFRSTINPVLLQVLRDMLMDFAVSKTNHDVNSTSVAFLESLRLPDLAARLDDETLAVGSHHQKLLVVGNSERTVAVLGGVDLHRNRVFPVQGSSGTPLWDVSLQLDGEAAADVADIFERRWNANPNRGRIANRTRPTTAPAAGGATVQIGVNYGCGRPHRDIPHPIRGADRLIRNILANCQSFFYAEDQYGVGNGELYGAIGRAFANGARYGVVVLAHAWGVDDLPEVEYRRHLFWTRFPQVRDGRLLVFQRRGDDGNRRGPHAYVHSKVVIVDDRAATISSVNMNRRSWYYDSELAAAIADSPDTIRALRMGIWRQHLKPRGGEVSDRDLLDPLAAFRLWQEAHARSAPWYDSDASSSPRPRLEALTFRQRPERHSARIISNAKAKLRDAIPLVGGPASWAAGEALGGPATRIVDNLVDLAFDNLFDPIGPTRC